MNVTVNKTTTPATTTPATTTTTTTAATTVAKQTIIPKKEPRKPLLPPPDIKTVNTIIDDYNSIIGKSREFRVLSSLFEKIIRLDQYDLKDFLYSVLTGMGYEVVYADGYLFAKGNVPVMLCSHMDTVHKATVKDICMSDKGYIWSPQGIGGDDRCGIYTAIMNIRDGIKPYILFTEDEEIGCIGAGYFVSDLDKGIIDIDDIDINFIIEIDRRGSNDSVYYSCDNPEFEKFINSYGFETAYGSCSDISDIAPALGVAAVNLSSAYYNPHTLDEYIKLDELYDIIDRVRTIVMDAADGKTIKYDYIERKYQYYRYGKYNSYRNDGWYDSWDEYDYGRTYSTDLKTYNNKKKETAKEEIEDEALWDDMILAAPINDDAYIISEGVMIEPEMNGDYYIDENNCVYKVIDMVDSCIDDCEYNMIVTPVSVSVYTVAGLPYQYHESDAEIVYVVKGEQNETENI